MNAKRPSFPMDDLGKETVLGFAKLIFGLGIFLFGPPLTFAFWQAWVYLSVFVGSAAVVTVYLWKKDPDLLERRVKAGPGAEKEKKQKLIQRLASLLFIGVIILPSIDHRFGWSEVPLSIVIAGDALVMLGFLVVFLVFKENTYSAATIQMVPGQNVIATGPYSLVRHPMYSGAMIMLFGTPLALGSWWGWLMFFPITLLLAWRLLEEEKFLCRSLSGYKEYCQKIRYRLIPFVW